MIEDRSLCQLLFFGLIFGKAASTSYLKLKRMERIPPNFYCRCGDQVLHSFESNLRRVKSAQQYSGSSPMVLISTCRLGRMSTPFSMTHQTRF